MRYAHEPRRRWQLLLVRRIFLWAGVVLIVGLNFVTEVSTFATCAGLLTAGLAVAMQSVLVSVVGEVIDLGLVRMHLMELNAQGPLGPTGRVVAFANLIVFQASGGLTIGAVLGNYGEEIARQRREIARSTTTA